jgi:hypothetical protein
MTAVDQTREIDPTPKRAVHAAQVVITTETVHTSTMRKEVLENKPNTMSLMQNHKRNQREATEKP